jgi:hypothetical protein
MTNKRVRELWKLFDAATQNDWLAEKEVDMEGWKQPDYWVVMKQEPRISGIERKADAEFIVAAHNEMPHLLGMLGKAMAVMRMTRETVARGARGEESPDWHEDWCRAVLPKMDQLLEEWDRDDDTGSD